jgi:hypothetical protein
VAPQFSPRFQRFARLAAGLYLSLAHGIRGIEMSGMEHLYEAMERFHHGETRLMILFRHVAVSDGPLVLAIVDCELPRWCRRNERTLPQPPHAGFLYGADVLNWAGLLARWSFPRMGGIPVENGLVNRQSQSTIREVLLHGIHPLAFAPEAQVTYHQFRTFGLAAGPATLARWTHQDLRSRGTSGVRVEILPLAIAYDYGARTPPVLQDVVRRVMSGLAITDPGMLSRTQTPDTSLLLELTECTLDQLEAEFPLTPVNAPPSANGKQAAALARRLAGVCESAIGAGERIAGLSPSGTPLQRVFRLRHWIRSSEHRSDVDPEKLPPLRRSVADTRSGLARAALPLERLADLMVYLNPDYIIPPHDTSAHRLLEYALNLLDLQNRAAGGSIDSRYTPGGRTARITAGEPIDASAILDSAAGGRESARLVTAAVADSFDSMVQQLERKIASG